MEKLAGCHILPILVRIWFRHGTDLNFGNDKKAAWFGIAALRTRLVSFKEQTSEAIWMEIWVLGFEKFEGVKKIGSQYLPPKKFHLFNIWNPRSKQIHRDHHRICLIWFTHVLLCCTSISLWSSLYRSCFCLIWILILKVSYSFQICFRSSSTIVGGLILNLFENTSSLSG